MRVSFIVTTYNIGRYIGRCLESVAAVAQADDEIIIVDDGSSDATKNIVRDFCFGAKRPKDITMNPVLLGENTMGGVGIAGNIGLGLATGDVVFFVDGDDWLDVDGFVQARKAFELRDDDIIIVNYQEFDEKNSRYKPPADEKRWSAITRTNDGQLRQMQALEMIAVPWRKFYRKSFLEEHNLRFPEGDFFFEDNPFHWAVCLATDRISFLDVTLCYHRVNRPGQTMASTGRELIAFLDHYQTILTQLGPAPVKAFKLQAISWLLGNMSWHLDRLQPKTAPEYFRKAEMAVVDIDASEIEDPHLASFAETEVFLYATLLRERGWTGALDYFLSQVTIKRVQDVQAQIDRTYREIVNVRDKVNGEILQDVSAIKGGVTSLWNSAYYDILRDTYFNESE